MPKESKPRKKMKTVSFDVIGAERKDLALKSNDEKYLAGYKKYERGLDLTPEQDSELAEAIGTITNMRSSSGKYIAQPIFKNGAELQGAIDAYWDWIQKSSDAGKTIIPDIEGLAAFLRVARSTLIGWKSGKTNTEFIPVLERFYNDVAYIKKQLGMRNKIPTLVYLNDMQNNHGYVSSTTKVEMDVTQREPMSVEKLIQQASELPD